MSLKISKPSLSLATIALFSLAGFSHASAQTTFTTGSGSAVGTVENSADFNIAPTSASSYSEGGLDFTAPNGIVYNSTFLNGGLDHMYYTAGGGNGFTTVAKSDNSLFHALEFEVDNGHNSATTFLHYEIFKAGVLQTSGSEDVTSGSTIGFLSPSGFDLLKIGAYTDDSDAQAATDTSFQALAIDDVLAGRPSSVTPEGDSFFLVTAGLLPLGGLALLRRRQRKA